MTHRELIIAARNLSPDDDDLIESGDVAETRASILPALETLQGHGVADEVSGDVEAPCGFFYRVDRWVVVVDNYGNKTLDEHANATYASEHFHALTVEFGRWLDA